MKRKTLTSVVLAGLLALFLTGIASAQEAPYNTTCTNGATNALAIFNAIYTAQGKTAPDNPTKLAFVDSILTHQGVDPAQYSNAQKACMFIDIVWLDLRARYREARRTAREAEVESTVDTNVQSDLSTFDAGG